jgi:hypothetical protein
METLYNLLTEIGREAERKVKFELSGPGGPLKTFFYNTMMPLVLNFETEQESYHFVFQTGGAVCLYRDLHANPDVAVLGEHAELIYLFKNQDAKRFELAEKTQRLKIVSHTFKGRQAVKKLRGLFLR